MLNRYLALAVLGGLLALPACTSGQSRAEPPYTPVNVGGTAKLQFQVGTANYAGTLYLNTVVSYRQPNGLSALLDSTPSITLPFTNTAPATAVNPGTGDTEVIAGNDSGTNKIGGTIQTNNGVKSSNPLSFAQDVGAFSYGFLASNSVTTGANNSVFYPAGDRSVQGNLYEGNRSPYYADAVPRSQRAFYVGPPFGTGDFASFGTTFLGYPSGFTTFALHPTTGTYTLSVGLPNASTPIPTFTATTTMSSLAMLPTMPAPTITSNGAGGATVALTVPAGISETGVFMRDVSPTAGVVAYYTVVFHGAGPQSTTFTGSVAAGDTIDGVAVGFDYPAMEAVPMGANPPQAPVINNSGTACSFTGPSSTCPGQADISVSPAGAGVE